MRHYTAGKTHTHKKLRNSGSSLSPNPHVITRKKQSPNCTKECCKNTWQSFISLCTLETQTSPSRGQLINTEWEWTIRTNRLQRKKGDAHFIRDSRTGDRSREKAQTGCSSQGERATDTPTQTRRKYSPVCTRLQRKEQDYFCTNFLCFLSINEVGLTCLVWRIAGPATKRRVQHNFNHARLQPAN